jgi:hypothetical protein
MTTMNRSTLILVLVVVAAVAVGAVVAGHGNGAGATAMGAYSGGNASQVGLADTATSSSAAANATGTDPAQQEPVLDKFHSRDPFIQVISTAAPSTGTTGGTSPAPSTSPTSQPSTPIAADIRITLKGAISVYPHQKVGAKLPPSNPAFKIGGFSPTGVDFTLLNGYTLSDGSTSFTIAEGQTTQVVLTKGTGGTQTTYTIKVVNLIYSAGGSGGGGSGGGGSGGGGSGGGSSASIPAGHSIKALSVDTQNGVASATIVVDSVTYANKKVGAVFTTGWGQIKIVGINAPGQTVTILHGDVQLTLHVGQTFSK